MLALSACAWSAPALESERHGEILWDNYGIPHIYAADVPSVIRGYGYAQMEAHARSVEALGRGDYESAYRWSASISPAGVPLFLSRFVWDTI